MDLRREIFSLLERFTHTRGIKLSAQGIRVDGPWGKGMPLRDLADGYRSSFLWLTDLIGWALTFRPSIKGTAGIRGIVLVDELEQHLHASWQRTVVDDLRGLLPNVQFIATTHSPLIASRLGTYDEIGSQLKKRKGLNSRDHLFVLEAERDEPVTCTTHEFMRGLRMDQVLATRAFKYLTDCDPVVEEMLRKASELAAKKNRTDREENLYRRINEALRPVILSDGQTLWERNLEISSHDEAMKRIRSLREKLRSEELM